MSFKSNLAARDLAAAWYSLSRVRSSLTPLYRRCHLRAAGGCASLDAAAGGARGCIRPRPVGVNSQNNTSVIQVQSLPSLRSVKASALSPLYYTHCSLATSPALDSSSSCSVTECQAACCVVNRRKRSDVWHWGQRKPQSQTLNHKPYYHSGAEPHGVCVQVGRP